MSSLGRDASGDMGTHSDEEDEVGESEVVDALNSVSSKKRKASALPKRGLKDFTVSDDPDQSRKLFDARQKWFEALSSTKEQNKKYRCIGVYRAHDNAVELTTVKGKYLTNLGYNVKGKTFLHLEEAAYMTDQAALLVFYEDEQDGIPMSFQELVALMVREGTPLEEYLVVAHLRRLGYVVATPREHAPARPAAELLPSRSQSSTALAEVAVPDASTPFALPSDFTAILSELDCSLDVQENLKHTVSPDAHVSPPSEPTVDYLGTDTVDAPVQLLRSRAWYPHMQAEPHASVLHANGTTSTITIRYRGEYRVPTALMPCARAPPRRMAILPPATPLAHRTQPLLATGTLERAQGGYVRSGVQQASAILRSLGVTEDCAVADLGPPLPACPSHHCAESAVVLATSSPARAPCDVYKPSANFSKRSPGTPSFKLSVRRYYDAPLSLEELARLKSSAGAIPLKFAAVSGGDITFFEFKDRPM